VAAARELHGLNRLTPPKERSELVKFLLQVQPAVWGAASLLCAARCHARRAAHPTPDRGVHAAPPHPPTPAVHQPTHGAAAGGGRPDLHGVRPAGATGGRALLPCAGLGALTPFVFSLLAANPGWLCCLLAARAQSPRDTNNVILAAALVIVVTLTCVMSYVQERSASNVMGAWAVWTGRVGGEAAERTAVQRASTPPDLCPSQPHPPVLQRP
jgi:hypothetical protein